MPRRRVSPVTLPDSEAFTAEIEARFAAYQQAHHFGAYRLPRGMAQGFIQWHVNRDTDLLDEQDREAAEWLYAVESGQLVEKAIPGLRRRRLVIFDASEVFRVVAAVHLELGHPGMVRTDHAVVERYAGIHLREIEWIVKHCRGCYPPHSPASEPTTAASSSITTAGSPDHVAPATSTAQPVVVVDEPSPLSHVDHSADPRTRGMSIFVGVLSIYIPSIAQGHLVLVVSASQSRRTVLINLPAFSPDSVALGIANWAVLVGWPRHVRFEETILGARVLRGIEERYGVQCELGAALPLQQTSAVMNMVREMVFAYFLRTAQPNWESALQEVNVELNLAGRPPPAIRECEDLGPGDD
jgi:hypothetical protein